MRYESRADLLIAAGESIKMQDNAGIVPVGKYEGRTSILKHSDFNDIGGWEFPLAVVEGKAVFVGDELYLNDIKYQISNRDLGFELKGLSWRPPKPKTITITIPVPVVSQQSGKSNCWLDVRFSSTEDRNKAHDLIIAALEAK